MTAIREQFRARVKELLPEVQFQTFPKVAIDAVMGHKLVLVVINRPGEPVKWAVVPDCGTLHDVEVTGMFVIIGLPPSACPLTWESPISDTTDEG